MQGVILAGGTRSRLGPLTRVINKHLLPVGRVPMIFCPLRSLVEAGIRQIMIVTGGNNAGMFLELLGSGKDFGLDHIDYAYQERPGGIAEALWRTASWTASGAMRGNRTAATSPRMRWPGGTICSASLAASEPLSPLPSG